MNKKEKRMHHLKALLKENADLSVRQLSNILNVSEMTIRRDLRYMEDNQMLIIDDAPDIYSPELHCNPSGEDYDLSVEEAKQNIEKDKIGRFAATLIESGDILIIDTGTTTEKLVKYIPNNIDITVLCYNYNIFSALREKSNVKLIFSGGYFHKSTQMLECEYGIQFIQSIRANKLFIAASGIHEKLGITCAESYETPTKRAVLQSALQKILIADSSKFGAVRTAYFAKLDEIDIIVTDSGLSEEWREIIRGAGIKLYLV